MNLAKIKDEGENGNADYTVAYQDFLKKVVNINYVMCDKSKEILKKYSIINGDDVDDNNNKTPESI